jgi:hypothetical protein
MRTNTRLQRWQINHPQARLSKSESVKCERIESNQKREPRVGVALSVHRPNC